MHGCSVAVTNDSSDDDRTPVFILFRQTDIDLEIVCYLKILPNKR